MNRLHHNAWTVIICGALILTLAMGVRQTMGLFLPEITVTHGWSRESFGFAIAMQNLLWGAFVPFAGAIADKYGAGRVLVAGALCYVAGLVLMANSPTPAAFGLSAGLLIGLALSGTTFGVVLGVIAKVAPPEHRSMAMGVASAGGSFGQFAMVPLGQGMISGLGWYWALLCLAVVAAMIVPLAAGMAGNFNQHVERTQQTARQAIGEAVGEKSFHFLFWSYFVCGVHTAFIGLHLPSYVIDSGLSPQTGMIGLALIGLGNIFGSYGAGWLGGKTSKKWLLTWIYGLRSIVILAFISVPISPWSLYLFAFTMGLLWLSTVPLTNGLVAQIYGLKYVSMLGGVVFFGHQIGGFLGAWLGGRIFDATQSYQLAWWIAIGLGIFAAVVCAPINEKPLLRAPLPQPAQ